MQLKSGKISEKKSGVLYLSRRKEKIGGFFLFKYCMAIIIWSILNLQLGGRHHFPKTKINRVTINCRKLFPPWQHTATGVGVA